MSPGQHREIPAGSVAWPYWLLLWVIITLATWAVLRWCPI